MSVPDVDDIVAFFAHILGQSLHLDFAKQLGVDEFDVPIAAFLLRPLVRDDLDAGLLRAFQHWGGDLHIKRNQADHVDLFSDEVLEQLDLLRRVDIGGSNHGGVDLEIRTAFDDALFQGVEPRNARDFDNHDHSRLGGERQLTAEAGRSEDSRTAQKFKRLASVHENIPSQCPASARFARRPPSSVRCFPVGSKRMSGLKTYGTFWPPCAIGERLREPDVLNRRIAEVADRGVDASNGRISAPTEIASGRTGVRAKARHSIAGAE